MTPESASTSATIREGSASTRRWWVTRRSRRQRRRRRRSHDINSHTYLVDDLDDDSVGVVVDGWCRQETSCRHDDTPHPEMSDGIRLLLEEELDVVDKFWEGVDDPVPRLGDEVRHRLSATMLCVILGWHPPRRRWHTPIGVSSWDDTPIRLPENWGGTTWWRPPPQGESPPQNRPQNWVPTPNWGSNLPSQKANLPPRKGKNGQIYPSQKEKTPFFGFFTPPQ